jgi:hypothetical protein
LYYVVQSDLYYEVIFVTKQKWAHKTGDLFTEFSIQLKWRKIVIFHSEYPKNFRASLRNWKKYDFLA